MPLDTVLDPEAILRYMKLFNHLWKIKRIEGTLSKGWMCIAGGSSTFLCIPVIECSCKNSLVFVHKKEGDLHALEH
ncbi:hypothetical protein BKA93DRAFT_825825 [Sparassis latifolia]